MTGERKTVLMRMLRGEISLDEVAAELSLKRSAVMNLKRRYLRGKLPKKNETLKAPVDQSVTVRRDIWGVAHIEAASVADCFAALGYAMAQDRLWQMDYMRRLARGELAEILGAEWLPQDRLHRTLGLTRAAQGAASMMSDEVRLVLQSLADGINAWMAAVDDRLPVEFELLDYAPRSWTMVDSITIWKWRWWMLTGRLGVISVGEAAQRHLPPDLLDLFLTIEAGDETIVPGDEPAGIGGHDTGIGSNNWVVGGERTVNGKPILATDPHNDVSLSRQWYQAQVTAPGLDAVGAFFLGTPGIYLGHTRHTAWGVTNHTASVRDLYVEEVSPDNPHLYRDGDTWREFEADRQDVPVRGESADFLVVRRTSRGPVVSAFVPFVDDGESPMLSMRWVGAEPTSGFESMLALMRSRNVDDVLAALADWPMPVLNFVFADTEGRFGYHAVGRVPKRKADAFGYRPANDPDHAWDGFYAFDELPHSIDPDCDWVATANNPPWGGRGPYVRLGSWADGYRYGRIRERIAERESHDILSVGLIQADATHGRGQVLAPIVAEIALAARNVRIRKLGELLRDWDGGYTTDSVAATVFTAFWEHWLRRIAVAQFSEAVVPLVAARCGGVARRILEGEASDWLGGDVSGVVRETLEETLAWLRKRLGTRQTQWRWGRLHTVTFRHPMSDGGAVSDLLDVGPFECSGSTGTVRAAGYDFGTPFEVTGLSTYRMVIDMAHPSKGLSTTAGGQSGHPGSPNYRTQSDLWADDGYHPLLMDREDVETNLESTLVLRPRGYSLEFTNPYILWCRASHRALASSLVGPRPVSRNRLWVEVGRVWVACSSNR